MHHSDLVFLYISNHIQLHAKITAKYVQKNAKGYSEICKYLFNIIIFEYMPKMQKEFLKIGLRWCREKCENGKGKKINGPRTSRWPAAAPPSRPGRAAAGGCCAASGCAPRAPTPPAPPGASWSRSPALLHLHRCFLNVPCLI